MIQKQVIITSHWAIPVKLSIIVREVQGLEMGMMHYDDLCAPTSSPAIKLHQYWEIDIKLNCPNQCHVPQFYIRSLPAEFCIRFQPELVKYNSWQSTILTSSNILGPLYFNRIISSIIIEHQQEIIRCAKNYFFNQWNQNYFDIDFFPHFSFLFPWQN